MDNPNPIYYSDLIKPDNSIEKLIEELDELIDKYESVKSKIQSSAAEVIKSVQGMSGATEEQRKAIQLATEQSDKLVAEYRDVTSASWKATQAFAEATAAKKESAQVDKLITQINTSAEGSYNRLSAQYRLNKIRLNEMSAAEREGTEEGRALERETAAIYEEMKRLQEATGKHTLNVGNYADAAKGLRQELMSLTQQMAYLKTIGQENSEEYKNMAVRAGQLKDAMMDAQQEVKAMSSDTRALDAVAGAASATQGGMAALTGVIGLMGATSEDASKAQKTLGSAIAVVSGLTAVQNALQKESNLMSGIGRIQKLAEAKATDVMTKAQGKNVIATKAATVAQRVLNAVAKANPYVLLAMALVTVVGALAAFALGTNRAAKEQKKQNEITAVELEYLDALAEKLTRVNDERIRGYEDELAVAQARGASLEETRAIEDKIYNERVARHNELMKLYADEVTQEQWNQRVLDGRIRQLADLKERQASGIKAVRIDVDLDGKLERMQIADAIDVIQAQIDNYGKKVEIATTLRTDTAALQRERTVQNEQRKKENQQVRKAEEDATRASEDAQMALIQNAYEREKAELKSQAQRRMQDLQKRLTTEKNLTRKARKAIVDEIKSINEKYYVDLHALQEKYIAKGVQAERESEDLRISLMEEGAEKQRLILYTTYKRQIEDLTTELRANKDLTDKQVAEITEQIELLGEKYKQELANLEGQILTDSLNTQIAVNEQRLDAVEEGSQEEYNLQMELLAQRRAAELAANAQLAADMRMDEADINAKWDAIVLKKEAELIKKRADVLLAGKQEMDASEFALLDRNERQKTQFALQQERERIAKVLELDTAAGGKLTMQQRQTLQNTLDAIDKEAQQLPYNNLYELLGIGLNSQQQDALNTAIDSIIDSIDSVIESWDKAADAALTAADKQVDAAQRALDAQIEARNAGYANDVATAQKELELAKTTQQKALDEKRKAQQAQIALDTAMQATSLITASANIWKALSGVPVVGPALAVAAIGTMWASFAYSKIKAVEVTRQEQYGQGTVEMLQGGSHASGNDIDLGRKSDGTRRRAEGGEFMAIVNRRNSRRYRKEFPEVIKSFNDGTFHDKYQRTDRYQRASAIMSGLAIDLAGVGSTDISSLERDVAAIRRNAEEMRYVDADGNTIIKYKNLTRKIIKNS